MLADEYPQFSQSPLTLGGTTVKLDLMEHRREERLSARGRSRPEVVWPLTDGFCGHRSGRLRDRLGHEWMIAQDWKRSVPREMQRRWDAMVPARQRGRLTRGNSPNTLSSSYAPAVFSFPTNLCENVTAPRAHCYGARNGSGRLGITERRATA